MGTHWSDPQTVQGGVLATIAGQGIGYRSCPSQGQLIAVPSIACLRRETNIIFCHLHFAPQAVPGDVVVAQHG